MMMASSSSSSSSTRLRALALYKSILRAHERYLPSQSMRQLGDAYVKSEVRVWKNIYILLHHNNTTIWRGVNLVTIIAIILLWWIILVVSKTEKNTRLHCWFALTDCFIIIIIIISLPGLIITSSHHFTFYSYFYICLVLLFDRYYTLTPKTHTHTRTRNQSFGYTKLPSQNRSPSSLWNGRSTYNILNGLDGRSNRWRWDY